MKKFILSTLLIYLLLPMTVFAYSDYIYASGKNIGIELKADYVLVVGSYKIDNYNVIDDTELLVGDRITHVNNYSISSAANLQKIIDEINEDLITVTYIRNNTQYKTNIPLFKEDGKYKTGLYVRDSIRGVATLTFIDPNDGKPFFGALGHEILEKSTQSRFESTNGTIFSSVVTGIIPSSKGSPGEKNARSNSNDVMGVVSENTISGIFGTYTDSLPNTKLYKVAKIDDIKLGPAKIFTVLSGNKVEEFEVNIVKINETTKTKNILFEVVDNDLLKRTGGIIQGMSGSPIIQGEYIVGAVNYVLVDSPKKGYGIFITNMLEEAEN